MGTLAPYLTYPSTDDVLRLVDTFRRSGRDVVFTRQVTQLERVLGYRALLAAVPAALLPATFLIPSRAG